MGVVPQQILPSESHSGAPTTSASLGLHHHYYCLMLNTWFIKVESYRSEVVLTSSGTNAGTQGAGASLPDADRTAVGAAWHGVSSWVQTGSQLFHCTCVKSLHQLQRASLEHQGLASLLCLCFYSFPGE